MPFLKIKSRIVPIVSGILLLGQITGTISASDSKAESPLLSWKEATTQGLIGPAVKFDKRIKVTASMHVDGSRVLQYRDEHTYIVVFDLVAQNIGHKPIRVGDFAKFIKTSTGRLLGEKEMLQSSPVSIIAKPGEDSNTRWEPTGSHRKLVRTYFHGWQVLMGLGDNERISQLVYNDGKSRLAWDVRSLEAASNTEDSKGKPEQ